MYEVETSGATPVITEVGMHQLRDTTGSGFGGMWGVDHLPCTLHGQAHTCIYSSDYEKFGLVVDALGYDPMLDPYAPTSAITDPTNGQQITGCTYTLHGTAHDYYSGVQRVEVSLDGGSTWQIAQGTDTWSYNWTIPGNGTYNLMVRAVDVANNVETPLTSISVTVSGCTGLDTATPTPVVPPTSTRTPFPPTNTVIPEATTVVPTAFSTNTPQPTATRTNTPVQPSVTPTSDPPPFNSPTSTMTPVVESSATSTMTPIAEASATATSCPIQFSDVPRTTPSIPTFAAWLVEASWAAMTTAHSAW